jgi:hypothetical protein
MEPVEVVARLLESAAHEFLCDTCLASALQVPVTGASEIGVALGAKAEFERRSALCAGCGLVAPAVAFVPSAGAAVLEGGGTPPKCVRCSRPIAGGQALVGGQGEAFHVHCWRILVSNSRIADSRQAARLSHELIQRSLERTASHPREANGR